MSKPFENTAEQPLRILQHNVAILKSNIFVYLAFLSAGEPVPASLLPALQCHLDLYTKDTLIDSMSHFELPALPQDTFMILTELLNDLEERLLLSLEEGKPQLPVTLKSILREPESALQRLQDYLSASQNQQQNSDQLNRSIIEGSAAESEGHFQLQRVNTRIDYPPHVFHYVCPSKHQAYISEAARAYDVVTPFKIKHLAFTADAPLIKYRNFFDQDLDPVKAIVAYCVPKTTQLLYYSLSDLCNALSLTKDFQLERKLQNQWNFGTETRTVPTPQGKLFAVNCRTYDNSIDPYLYQITDRKASNRGPIPTPRRHCAVTYLAGSIYLVGGQAKGQKYSKQGSRYNLKDKQWKPMGEASVGLIHPTVCAVSGRYLCKLGGLNEFDYINKTIEMYDSVSCVWALVRASARDITQEVEILERSLAVQISDDQIFIFGGSNSNKYFFVIFSYASDSSFVLTLNEISQRKRGGSKVNADMWRMSLEKRTLLSFTGLWSQATPILHHNCIYVLRADT